ncbi:Cro/CI family transcriptional regulator [Pseudomonas sp. AL 58]|uniref:Cro/CI family transcriptional regulator n=1 Tax=Pseudomonas sp. AL 58 TaxID=3104275 RepID=UPI002EB326E9|nr:Cro/CI family transcriptional regulator [Pseudomonas sp. AL 58]
MQTIPLADFVAEVGQLKAAIFLGMSQGGVSKALRVGRDVRVTKHTDGTYSAEEIRPFPCQVQPKKSDA